jgi:signal transduction histidine kinase
MELKSFFSKKISRRLIISFLAFALLIVIVSYAAILGLNEIAKPISSNIPKVIITLSKSSSLDSEAQFIRYYDEVLTQSARNYAFTSDAKWKDRYNAAAPELDKLIKDAIDKGDEEDKKYFSSIEQANLDLVKLELKSIELVDKGQQKEAINILESKEYWDLKAVYENGLRQYINKRGSAYNEVLSASTADLDSALMQTEQKISYYGKLFLVFSLCVLALTIILSFIFSQKLSGPINELLIATKEVEKGNFSARTNIKSGNELEKLGDSLNKTIETLERTHEERKQIDDAKTQFLSITSHELRSPMTPMRAQLQMLEEGYFGQLNNKQKDAIDIILRNTERLDNIIQEFLEISRIETARLKFNFTKTNLRPYIKNLVEEMKGFAPEKNIEIVTRIKPLPTIEVDPDRAMQVLRNLLNNAKKFSPEKSKIYLTVEPTNKVIIFSVKNEGVGIKPEAKRKIFEPFFQAEQTIYRAHRGTGLGLAICKGLVEAQNGKIWFESQPGKGTTFYFTIPLKPEKEMKPIRLLFSEQAITEKKVEELFKKTLGPMGASEFEEFKNKNQLTEENLIDYANELKKKGVIRAEYCKQFKQEALNILRDVEGEKTEETYGVSETKLKKAGLVK